MRITFLSVGSFTLSIFALAACAGCSSPSGGQSSSESLSTSGSHIATAQYTQNENQAAPVLTINVGDDAIECASGPAVGATYLGISVGDGNPAAGTYSVGDPSTSAKASAHVVRLKSAGQSAVSSVEEGATGTITISHLFAVGDDPASSSVSGTYDITFPDGHLTGTFDAQACPSSLNQLVPSAAP